MKWAVHVKSVVEAVCTLEFEADTERDAEMKARQALGIGKDGPESGFDQEIVEEVLSGWADQIRDLSRTLDQQDVAFADIEVEPSDEEPCRDCGVPCSHDKDADGFHKED